MALTVRRLGGTLIEYASDGVLLDPTHESLGYPCFVSHAHADHASAFRYKSILKYATEPTVRLVERLGWRSAGECRRLSVGGRVRVGDIEVRVHNAGHVIGSAQFEAATPEGTVLYTGDFNLDSYMLEPAQPVNCDLLVIETTFGAPMFSFPKRTKLALDLVKWAALESVPSGKIPTFKTDAIGNAQEIIAIFNRMTRLPVVTYRSVTKASDVYREYGHRLEYSDAEEDEGRGLLESGKCVLIVPKGSRLSQDNLDISFASGWAAIANQRWGRPFPLSDHADFKGLLSYIRRCRPRKVLTFHGGGLTRDFAGYVKRRLGIDARPLTGREETLTGTASRSEGRMRACSDQILSVVKIPGFSYTSPWLVREMARKGFTKGETEESIRMLVERGALNDEGSDIRLR